jgi:2-polyprenyl-3-methyl-5-hydroxy-6-metoxy-1,4-benzoquinol methylase
VAKMLLKYNYPQAVFAKEIIAYLLDTGRSCKTIIDCPCGNGETAWHLSHIGGKVIAADSSPDAINRAASNFSGSKLSYEINTIVSVLNAYPQFDVFCIINYLFLF